MHGHVRLFISLFLRPSTPSEQQVKVNVGLVMFHGHVHAMFVVNVEFGGVMIQSRHGIIRTRPRRENRRRTAPANVQHVFRQGMISGAFY
jgi:hypothetical protein